jgi:hypothetical protein
MSRMRLEIHGEVVSWVRWMALLPLRLALLTEHVQLHRDREAAGRGREPFSPLPRNAI